MNKLILTSTAVLLTVTGYPADLTKARFTQVVNQVKIISSSTKGIAEAKVDLEFLTPDLVQTGPRSLAELRAPDDTITRVGSNTIFSFARRGREVNLQRGSLLFQSPKGKGGGTIRTKAASASVLGTTIMITATIDGGFKSIVLEGRCQIQLPNGDFRQLDSGQVTFVLPGEKGFGPTLDVNLEKLVEGSKLVQGFEEELPSKATIDQEVEKQVKLIESGQAEDTGLLVGQKADEDEVQVVKSEFIEQTVSDTRSAQQRALDTDVTQAGTTLNGSRVFASPINPVPSVTGTINNGFLANNATFTGNGINFGPYTGAGGNFGVLAKGTLAIKANTALATVSARQPASSTHNFSLFASSPTPVAAGPGTPTTLPFNTTLAGRQGLTIDPNTQINAVGVGNVTLASGSTMALNNVSVFNQNGSVTVNANSDLETSGGTFSPSSVGYVKFKSVAGNAMVVNTGFSTSTVMMQAAQSLNVNGASFSGLTSIAMDARTVNMWNLNFAAGTTVNLRSQIGQLAPNPNTGAPSVPGHVNFIQNVNYGGEPAQFAVGAGINISPLP